MRQPAFQLSSRPSACARDVVPIDMHDNHLVNVIAKAEREGDVVRLKALKAEQTRRG